MAFIGTFSRALLESATAVYFGGVPVSLLDAQGNVILGEGLPDAPTITSTIADRTYEAGGSAVTVDLRTKFDGATSYTVSPSSPAVSIDGYTLTINPISAMTATTFTVRGINGGGSSAPLTFTLTVTAPLPVLLKPFPDQSLLIGGGTVTLPLAEYFSGAAGYAVSPANNGVTISNGNLVISRTTARDVIITVTATNATGQDTSDSFALLVAAPANQAPVASAIPQQNPTANTAFTVDLSSYFVDPEGASLSFDYTGTLPTGITRNGAVFIGTATVTDQTASGVLRARDPGNLEAEAPVTWAVAAQPTLQATITPDPLVAGQQASITFSTTIDGPPTIAQGQTAITATRVGQTNEWTFTPVAAGALIIAATAEGYASSPWTFEVAPAPADLIVTPSSIFAIANVDASSPTETLVLSSPTAPAEMMGEWEIDFAPLASGPVLLRDPYITGTPAVGETMTLHLPPPLSLIAGSEPTFDWSWPDGSKGKTYVNRTQDEGVPYDVEVTLTDGIGARSYTTNAVSVPAAGLANGLTPIGVYNLPRTVSAVKEIPIQLGASDPAKTMVFALHDMGNVTPNIVIVAGGVEYPTTVVGARTSATGGAVHLALLEAAIPVGGAAILRITYGSAQGGNPTAMVWAAKGLTRVTASGFRVAMTAGEPVSRTLANTQVGDRLLYAIASAPYATGGLFSGAAGVTERADLQTGTTDPAQFWAADGTESAAVASRSVSVVPAQSGNSITMVALYRSV